ncbi:MAG TPA: AAA family ATPase [Acidimicrobiales bacterium]|nr:AAA family ATPase [Acidimicrobiales bacterium]
MPGAEVRETHISIVLLLDDRVLKIRKPVALDFLDFSTIEARARDCRREVELNSRLAPDVYLGAAEVILGADVIDHMVVMRRLPDERSLSHVIAANDGSAPAEDIRSVAQTLFAFHNHAERSAAISLAGTKDAVSHKLEADIEETRRFVGATLDGEIHHRIAHSFRRYLQGRGPLFTERVAEGLVCDGHGDLQADDIYLLDDGPRILDCLEFDDALRYGDVAADIAFLAMDLERRGSPSSAAQLLSDYEDLSARRIPPSLFHFYVAAKALIRAKVACLRHEQGDAAAATAASSLLHLSHDHLERGRVRMVLIGGLPGSGKSTLSSSVAKSLGWTIIRSDSLRREKTQEVRAGHPGPNEFQRGQYSPEITSALYNDMNERAARLLGFGQSVIVDASWTSESNREGARNVARENFADLVELECVAPDTVAEDRLARRLRVGEDPSEATLEIRRAMAARQSEWPDAVKIDTSGVIDEATSTALTAIETWDE